MCDPLLNFMVKILLKHRQLYLRIVHGCFLAKQNLVFETQTIYAFKSHIRMFCSLTEFFFYLYHNA